MSIWSILWIIVGSAGGLLELAALRNPARGDTASEHVWKLPKVGRYGIAAFLIWLTVHFLGG